MYGLDLLPYQRRFMRAVANDRYNQVAFSAPRGAGKSMLGGLAAASALERIESHQEICLFAASIEQSRIVFRYVRKYLGEANYRYQDSTTKVAVTRKDGARLRVVGRNPRTSMGLVDVPVAIVDEPGSMDLSMGQDLWDAIATARGKVGSPLRVVLLGTLAPLATAPGHWWYDVANAKTEDRSYVQLIQGRKERWDDWKEALRVNPLARAFPEMRRQLRIEYDEALRDSRLRARFLSYRLNVPSGDDSTMLLSVADWERVIARDVLPRDGRPVVAIDMGGGRAWSAAVALWPNGRTEALALAPGVPDLRAQEKRDKVPPGRYRALASAGYLVTADGLRIPPACMLLELVALKWGKPRFIVCDRFRLPDLLDANPPCQVVPRVTRWSEAAADIRDLRAMALDGNMCVEDGSQDLITASLAVACVRNDDQGNVRMVKRVTNNSARDDVAAALVLAAGALGRMRRDGRPQCRVAVV